MYIMLNKISKTVAYTTLFRQMTDELSFATDVMSLNNLFKSVLYLILVFISV
jgi:hypothetical protein